MTGLMPVAIILDPQEYENDRLTAFVSDMWGHPPKEIWQRYGTHNLVEDFRDALADRGEYLSLIVTLEPIGVVESKRLAKLFPQAEFYVAPDSLLPQSSSRKLEP